MFQKKTGDRVQCQLCPHMCILAEGETGKCGVRQNQGGSLQSLNWGKLVAAHLDPIEKKPLFQFSPGSLVYSIAAPGCNLKCKFCQNWSISQEFSIPERTVAPEEVVNAALESGAQGIAYTYSEPTVFFEYAYETAKLARKNGLFNVWVSNGMLNPEPLKKISRVIDAINIDLKAFSDRFYREVCGGTGLSPIIRSIREFYKNKVWVEVTLLLIPGLNDDKTEIREMVDWLSRISPKIPFHISRFYPNYKMQDIVPTPAKSLEAAYAIAKGKLKYVYIGNFPGHASENTYCPNCGKPVVERRGFRAKAVGLKQKKCAYCGAAVDIVGELYC